MFSMFMDVFEAVQELNGVLRSQGRTLGTGARELNNIVFRVKKTENDFNGVRAEADRLAASELSNRLRAEGVDSLVTTKLKDGTSISVKLSSKGLRIESTVIVHSAEANVDLPRLMCAAMGTAALVADEVNCPLGECCCFVEQLLLKEEYGSKEMY